MIATDEFLFTCETVVCVFDIPDLNHKIKAGIDPALSP